MDMVKGADINCSQPDDKMEVTMAKGKKRIAIIACKNIKGVSCVGGCLKCFKGISERAGSMSVGRIMMLKL